MFAGQHQTGQWWRQRCQQHRSVQNVFRPACYGIHGEVNCDDCLSFLAVVVCIGFRCVKSLDVDSRGGGAEEEEKNKKADTKKKRNKAKKKGDFPASADDDSNDKYGGDEIELL
jgi:hypothetical protein